MGDEEGKEAAAGQFILPLQRGWTTLIRLLFLPPPFLPSYFRRSCPGLMFTAHSTSCDPFSVQHAGEQDEDEAVARPDDRVQNHFWPGLDRRGVSPAPPPFTAAAASVLFVSIAK